MSDWIATTCERRIVEAMERGDFDDLPGYGRPIPERDDSWVPEELRLAYKLLRDSGYLPPEMSLQKEIRTLSDLLARIDDEDERRRLNEAIREQTLRLNLMWKRAVYLEAPTHVARTGSKIRP